MSAHSCRIGAMKDRKIGVAAICQDKAYVVFDNGLQLPIIGWLNENREPCRLNEEPRFYEFGDEENGFGVGNFDSYDMPSWEDH